VVVRGGQYPEQTILVDARKTSRRDVLFRPASGARVVVGGGGVTVWGRHIEFRDMRFLGGWYAKPRSADLTFRRINTKHFFISGARDIRLIRGRVGPGVDYHPIIAPEGSIPPRNILIDRVTFHNWTASNASVHTECLQVASPNGFVLRRSRFRNCAIFALFMTHWGTAGHPKNIRIENNFFDKGIDGSLSVRFANWPPVWENVLVRNNSAIMGISVDPTPRKVNFRVIANIAPLGQWGCTSGVVYRHNVWGGARCSRTDRNAAPGFRDPARLDLRLKPGAAAINRGDPRSFPRVDIFGRQRPIGRRPDAGAHEAR
jgi:hypothetical protein